MPRKLSLSLSRPTSRPSSTHAPEISKPARPALPRSNSAPNLSTGTSAKSDFKADAKRPAPVTLAPRPQPQAARPDSGRNLFAEDLAARREHRTGAKADAPQAPALKNPPAHWDKLDWKPGWDPDAAPAHGAAPSKFQTAWLPNDSKEFQDIKRYLETNSVAKPYTAPKREQTRMDRAKSEIDAAKQELASMPPGHPGRAATEEKLRAAEHRFREGKPGGPPPPHSSPVEVTKIKVIRNPETWNQYVDGRQQVASEVGHSGKALDKVKWTSQDKASGLPVVDPRSGEAYLMHGTSEHVGKLIAENNFAPHLATNKGTAEKPRFGALGQGTYFSDNLAKVSTYLGDGKDPEKFVLLSRTTLGRPHTVRSHGEFDKLGFSSQRDKTVDQMKPGRHSNYGKGVPFTFGERPSLYGSNEFLLKNKAQMYPEYVVYFRNKDSQ